MTRSPLLALVALVAGLHTAAAQPEPGANKLDAKALMQSGIKLFEAKDYLGALAVFKNAYAQFASTKILLNIGTTQIQLDRKADAANSYQRYLDSADADPAKKADVAAELAKLDEASGILDLAITPEDAEVLLGDEWRVAKSVRVWRVPPGTYTIKVRRESYTPAEKTDAINPGARVAVAIELAAIPKQVNQVIVRVPSDELAMQEPRSWIGAIAATHVSVVPKLGSAVFVGATADVLDQLSVDAAVILGPGIVDSMGTASLAPPKFGAYAGAAFAFLTGQARPRVSVGLPIFFDSATSSVDVFARGAGGLEYVWNRHVALVLDVGVEVALKKAADIRAVALVPSLGVSGRL